MDSLSLEPLHIPHLYEIVVFLLASVVIVPTLRKLRASPVLGFLFTGLLIGPYGLGVIEDVESVAALAELGVIFLLFTIGLELSIGRLKALSSLVFGMGLLQVVCTSLVIGGLLRLAGYAVEAAVIVAMSVAMSSTAIVVQLLVERRELSNRLGRLTFAVLLFQDLAVVPLLVLIGIFGRGDSNVLLALGQGLLRGALAVGVIVAAGRWLLRPVFRVIAATRSPDLFMATTLLSILLIASATGLAGLSMALGAFLAGLMLSETAYRHQIEVDIEPFRGLLLGLFFISVGMQMDTAAMLSRPFSLVGAVAALVAIKALLVVGLGRIFGQPFVVAARAGLLLGPIGEFAFVAIGLAMTAQVVPRDLGQFTMLVVSLSMALTPVLNALGLQLERRMTTQDAGREDLDAFAEGLDRHVIVAGFDRVGQMVAKLLADQQIPYVVVDNNPKRVAQLFDRGVSTWYGDASRVDVLRKVGADRAALALVTFAEPTASAKAVGCLREEWPDLPVFARARDTKHAQQLESMGASMIVAESLEASLQLSAHALSAMGVRREELEQVLDAIRLEHYAGALELAEDVLLRARD